MGILWLHEKSKAGVSWVESSWEHGAEHLITELPGGEGSWERMADWRDSLEGKKPNWGGISSPCTCVILVNEGD